MQNALTIDLEDYYHVTAFSENGKSPGLHSHVGRVELSTEKTLAILAENGCHATFFTLGSVAEQFPRLIRRVADAGHEIACHSFGHRQVFSLSPEQFREDTRHAKQLLEDASGRFVRGYRAPSFSILKESIWAFEVLAELGFTYDSSVFPVSHLNYGIPTSPRDPFVVKTPSGSILEFPMPSLSVAGTRAPFAGGAYFRFLPYWYTRWGIRYLNHRENRPVCVYLHPWELDPEQPKMKGGITARMRHYFGLRGTEQKLRRLLHDFDFGPLGTLIEDLRQNSLTVPQKELFEIPLNELGAYLDHGQYDSR
jgi:polysaccharide deacetylase family protein (PEP-CTERM system associated)